jgi:hypothetical protein
MRLPERQFRLLLRLPLDRLRNIPSGRCLARRSGPFVDALAGLADGIRPVG